jgi:hypothetical protein
VGERGWEIVAVHRVVVSVSEGEVGDRGRKEGGGKVRDGFAPFVA